MSFVITQSTIDVPSLYYIKDNLGFGKIISQSTKQKTHRFIIQDYINLYLICLYLTEIWFSLLDKLDLLLFFLF